MVNTKLEEFYFSLKMVLSGPISEPKSRNFQMISGLNSKKNKDEICKNIKEYINIYKIHNI